MSQIYYSTLDTLITDLTNGKSLVKSKLGASYNFTGALSSVAAGSEIPDVIDVITLFSKADIERYINKRKAAIDSNFYYLGIQHIVLLKWNFSEEVSSAVVDYVHLIENTTIIQCVPQTNILANFYSKFNWNSEWNSFGAPQFIGTDLVMGPIEESLVTSMEHFHMYRCPQYDWTLDQDKGCIVSSSYSFAIAIHGYKKIGTVWTLDLSGITGYRTVMYVGGMWYSGTNYAITLKIKSFVRKVIVYTHGVTSIHGGYQADSSNLIKFKINKTEGDDNLKVIDLAGSPTITVLSGGSGYIGSAAVLLVVRSRPQNTASGDIYGQEYFYQRYDSGGVAIGSAQDKAGSLVSGVQIKLNVIEPIRPSNYGDAYVVESDGLSGKQILGYDPIPIECLLG